MRRQNSGSKSRSDPRCNALRNEPLSVKSSPIKTELADRDQFITPSDCVCVRNTLYPAVDRLRQRQARMRSRPGVEAAQGRRRPVGGKVCPSKLNELLEFSGPLTME